MSTMTMRSAILPSLLVLAFCAHFGLGLQCYQCQYVWVRVEYPDGTSAEQDDPPGDKSCITHPSSSTIETCSFGQVCVSENFIGESDNLPDFPDHHVYMRIVSRGCFSWPYDEPCVNHGDFPNVPPELTIHPSSEACKCEGGLCNTNAFDESNEPPNDPPKGSAPSVRMSTVMIITAVVAYLGF